MRINTFYQNNRSKEIEMYRILNSLAENHVNVEKLVNLPILFSRILKMRSFVSSVFHGQIDKFANQRERFMYFG